MTEAVKIDEAKLKEQIAKLPKDQLEAELLKIRTRQKTQQLKQQGKGGQSAYQKRQREKFKLMKEQALNTPANDPQFANRWEEINAAAGAAAKAKVGA